MRMYGECHTLRHSTQDIRNFFRLGFKPKKTVKRQFLKKLEKELGMHTFDPGTREAEAEGCP